MIRPVEAETKNENGRIYSKSKDIRNFCQRFCFTSLCQAFLYTPMSFQPVENVSQSFLVYTLPDNLLEMALDDQDPDGRIKKH